MDDPVDVDTVPDLMDTVTCGLASLTTMGVATPSAFTVKVVGVNATVAAPPLTVVARLSDATDTSADLGSSTESCAMAISSSDPLLRIDTILFELIA